MKDMQMTPSEILADYRQAKDGKSQINVLADLNCCHRNDIIRILREQGEELPGIRLTKSKIAAAIHEKATAEETALLPPPPPLADDDFPEGAARSHQEAEIFCTSAAEDREPEFLTVGQLMEFLKGLRINPDTKVFVSGFGYLVNVSAGFHMSTRSADANIVLMGEDDIP